MLENTQLIKKKTAKNRKAKRYIQNTKSKNGRQKYNSVIFLIKTSFPTISLMTLNVIELMNPIKSQRLSYWLKK